MMYWSCEPKSLHPETSMSKSYIHQVENVFEIAYSMGFIHATTMFPTCTAREKDEKKECDEKEEDRKRRRID